MTLLIAAYCLSLSGQDASVARQDAPLIRTTFAKDEDGWTAVQAAGKQSKVSVVHEDPYKKVGDGSLKYEYTIGKGELSAARLPIPEGSFAKMRSLHFWIRAGHNGPLLLTLEERDGGGRYVSLFYGLKDVWQEVNLGLSDFSLSTGNGSPADPDNRLDTDQIDAVNVADLDQFLDQSDELKKMAKMDEGARSLYISDFEALPTALPYASLISAGESRLDTYIRPQIGWGALGITGLSMADGAPLGERAVRVDYHTTQGQVSAVIKQFPAGRLEGMKSLSLRLASAKPCKLLIQTEEDDGVKYNTTYDLPGDSTALTASLAFPSFTLGEVPDKNGKIDVQRVHQITIIDLTGVVESKNQDNTLWIGAVAGKS